MLALLPVLMLVMVICASLLWAVLGVSLWSGVAGLAIMACAGFAGLAWLRRSIPAPRHGPSEL